MEWADGKKRCAWANPGNPRYIRYHDTEWGVPVYEDGKDAFRHGIQGSRVTQLLYSEGGPYLVDYIV